MRSRCSYDSSGLALVDLLSSRPHSPAIAGALSLYQREHKTAGLRALAACKATASQPHLIILELTAVAPTGCVPLLMWLDR
jgi:hypothetical protein